MDDLVDEVRWPLATLRAGSKPGDLGAYEAPQEQVIAGVAARLEAQGYDPVTALAQAEYAVWNYGN